MNWPLPVSSTVRQKGRVIPQVVQRDLGKDDELKELSYDFLGTFFTTAQTVNGLLFVANGLEQYAKDHDNGQGNTGPDDQRERS